MDRPPLNEEEQAARQELTYLLRLLLSGHDSYIDAAPRIVHLRSRVGGVGDFDNDFMAFVGISSETDHLPMRTTRHLWAEHAIKTKEAEIAKLERWAAGLAKDSCLALLARFGETSV
jgi:hypothetical protein